MRILALGIALVFSVGVVAFLSLQNKVTPVVIKHANASQIAEPNIQIKKKKAQEKALHFADSMQPWLIKNGYSTHLLFIADLGITMYAKRFYVMQPDSHKIINHFLVAHGAGLGSTADSVVFSNVIGSNCSSKGKYKIAESMYGNYGKGYRLDGLDATNNNARIRLVVFHHFTMQTEEEFSSHNYMSSGCPMLNTSNFNFCDSLIQQEKKPVLLVIYK